MFYFHLFLGPQPMPSTGLNTNTLPPGYLDQNTDSMSLFSGNGFGGSPALLTQQKSMTLINEQKQNGENNNELELVL